MKQKLLLFPFNGNAVEALDSVGDAFEVIGFVDDETQKQGKSSFGYYVYSRKAISKYKEAKILAVPGSPSSYLLRKKIISGLNIPDERFASIIHPSACISEFAEIGFNNLIMAGVVISAMASIGDHVCILPNTVIHHDSSIGDYSLIGGNVVVAGHTKIGKNCYIGSGSNIINNISIGNNVLVGLGGNVIKSIEDNKKVAGNPAKEI